MRIPVDRQRVGDSDREIAAGNWSLQIDDVNTLCDGGRVNFQSWFISIKRQIFVGDSAEIRLCKRRGSRCERNGKQRDLKRQIIFC